MEKLANSIRETRNRLDGYTTGRAVVEDEKAYLHTDEGKTIELSPNYIIEVYTEDHGYQRVYYEQMITAKVAGTDWPLLAGFDARVKYKGGNQQ